MRAFRIADRRFAIFDGTGARLIGGRWNSPGRPIIYAAETFAGAVLEVLVHSNLGRVPSNHRLIEINIPDDVPMHSVAVADLPGWDKSDFRVSRKYGDKWLLDNRSAVLLVPSAVTHGHERNVLINPEHPDFDRITVSVPQPVSWDGRLFQ